MIRLARKQVRLFEVTDGNVPVPPESEQFHSNGVDFKEDLYIPEKNPTPGELFHEHEDHNHLQNGLQHAQGKAVSQILASSISKMRSMLKTRA